MNKRQLLVMLDTGEINLADTSQLIKENLVNFKTWHCEVFSHGQTVFSQRGTVGYTTCGNKSEICNIGVCSCPTDIYVPKAKSIEYLQIFRSTVDENKVYNRYTSGNIVAVGTYELLQNQTFIVDWNLLKRCNFSCSYCAPDIHDFESEYPPLSVYVKHLQTLKNIDKNLYFILQGGEPTIHPNIFEIVKMCSDVGKVEIVTNGTASVEKYKKLLQYADINISLHHELINEKHMEKFVKLAQLGIGNIVLKYFNTFDEDRFSKYLNVLNNFEHVSLISNKRIIARRFNNKDKKKFNT